MLSCQDHDNSAFPLKARSYTAVDTGNKKDDLAYVVPVTS